MKYDPVYSDIFAKNTFLCTQNYIKYFEKIWISVLIMFVVYLFPNTLSVKIIIKTCLLYYLPNEV